MHYIDDNLATYILVQVTVLLLAQFILALLFLVLKFQLSFYGQLLEDIQRGRGSNFIQKYSLFTLRYGEHKHTPYISQHTHYFKVVWLVHVWVVVLKEGD